jgi:GT2 family glycosyltransferase
MSAFRLVDLDLAAIPQGVALSGEEAGLALVVRQGGRPVGFAMHDAPAGSHFDHAALRRLAHACGAEGAVIDALRRELGGAAEGPTGTVTIAVCTHDRPRLLERCLTSIRMACARPAARSLVADVVVVDNAPSDGSTRAVVERFHGVRYVLAPVAGLDVARNAAWRTARADYVAYVDDDVVLDTAWAEGCGAALRAHPDVGLVTGLVLPYALATTAQVLFERAGGFRRGFRPQRWQGAERAGDPLYPLGAGRFGAGCNMVIRRTVLAALGGFDDALDTGAPLPGGGDLDIFYRVLRAGHALVYEPAMAVHHEHRCTLDELTRQYFTWGQGFLAFLGKVWIVEPDSRPRVRRMMAWWGSWMLRRLAGALLKGPDPLPVPMLAAELAGGVQGVFGEYRRSQARMRALEAGSW